MEVEARGNSPWESAGTCAGTRVGTRYDAPRRNVAAGVLSGRNFLQRHRFRFKDAERPGQSVPTRSVGTRLHQALSQPHQEKEGPFLNGRPVVR